jgi:hypothetical protein
MKTYQSVLIAGLMAMGLAACSSTDMHASSSGSSSMGATRSGTPADIANATDRTNGSNGGGADNSMGNNAGTGNSGAGSNSR